MCSVGQVYKHGSNVTLVNNLLAFLWTSYKSNDTELLHLTLDPAIYSTRTTSVSAPSRGPGEGQLPAQVHWQDRSILYFNHSCRWNPELDGLPGLSHKY